MSRKLAARAIAKLDGQSCVQTRRLNGKSRLSKTFVLIVHASIRYKGEDSGPTLSREKWV